MLDIDTTAFKNLAFRRDGDIGVLSLNRAAKRNALDADTIEYLTIDATYAGYLERQQRDIDAFKRDEGLRIPDST